MDLTPLLALAVLHLVKSLLESFVGMETFSAGYILAILVSVVWRDLCSFLLFLLIVAGRCIYFIPDCEPIRNEISATVSNIILKVKQLKS